MVEEAPKTQLCLSIKMAYPVTKIVGESNLSRTDILLKVKETEAKARSIIEEAEEEKKAIIAKARRDSVKMVQDAEAKIRADFESKISEEMKKLASQREVLLRKGEEEAARLEAVASKRMAKVKDFLKKEFERSINATS
ncbi:MAG: V/A-type H+/Na+-transporting ATPase subunit [Candidatus Methanomethylophilaceae archaeon]|nr:V/A-type H+/Na+-transporting ATPase subunit [Candidatus Methanomethylophilaceae archaeon]